MSGTWTGQNKILPGAYVNFVTNAPLSISPGERGTVVILQEMSTGTVGDIYTITATDHDWPAGATTADKLLANETLKGCSAVLVYNLGTTRSETEVSNALAALKIVNFNTLTYPYDATTDATPKGSIKTWLQSMRDTEGSKIQAVLANHTSDYEGIINVAQGVVLSDGTALTAAQTCAWVAGITAGASISTSNTGRIYEGAIDVNTRKTKTELEAAITAGQFVFKVDSAQNVSVVYDINSLTTVSEIKSSLFMKNRIMRTLDGINNDITQIFESQYIGKVNNNADGRSLLRASLVDYFKVLQQQSAIQNFDPEDVSVTVGKDSDAVVIDCYVQPVDSVEKIYITVNLS